MERDANKLGAVLAMAAGLGLGGDYGSTRRLFGDDFMYRPFTQPNRASYFTMPTPRKEGE